MSKDNPIVYPIGEIIPIISIKLGSGFGDARPDWLWIIQKARIIKIPTKINNTFFRISPELLINRYKYIPNIAPIPKSKDGKKKKNVER